MGNKSLKNILLQMAIQIMSLAIIIFGSAWSFLDIGLYRGWIYPANYPEQEVQVVKKALQQPNFSPQQIPSIYQYCLFKHHKVIAKDLSPRYQYTARQVQHTHQSQTKGFIAPRIFMYLTGSDYQLVLSYRITAYFVSPRIRRILPSAELTLIILASVLWIIGFIIIVNRTFNQVNHELVKIKHTNQQIQQLNLDLESPHSSIQEVEMLLQSINQMKAALQQSLQQQWQSQQQLQKAVQEVTHDIRTPITLIKGNLELLAETLINSEQQELIQDANQGVKRLEAYVSWLKHYGKVTPVTDYVGPITDKIVQQWQELAQSLARHQQIKVRVLQADTSNIQVNLFQITQALQNVLLNSVEFSPLQSTIQLSLQDFPNQYRITVIDNGPGFSREAQQQATKRYYSQHQQTSTHLGLGLNIVQQIMEQNRGQLVLSNYYQQSQFIGGKVQLILAK